MTTIQNNGSVLAGSAGQPSQPASSVGGANLGQQDFLTLLTTQLQNQDPFSPMESGEFLAQMAQFSTVSGISEVNDTLGDIGDQIGEFRIATAANLLGQEVLIPGNMARPDANGVVHGAVELPEPANVVTVTYSHPDTGALLHTQTYSNQPKGMMGFSWEDVPATFVDNDMPLRVGVNATTNDGTSTLGPSVFAQVMSVTMGSDASDYKLETQDHGTVTGRDVTGLR